MEAEYEKKFEDMKKYIPFLDNMIMRLETSSSTENPRRAQLNKIRALRDLLMDKSKRMKMENLNKCEQVLINLYNKVEQTETLSTIKALPCSSANENNHEGMKQTGGSISSTTANKSQIRSVCNVVNNSPVGVLFLRRPKRETPSPPVPPIISDGRRYDEASLSRRNYTRVLVSPDNTRHLYQRRSPKTTSFRSPIQSPHKRSPSYKKSKKSSKRNRSRMRSKPKDINITINVPDKSLKSLNAEDIIDRIKKCDDKDVDLEILQSIRSQLFHELKQTGINTDISNIILQSYDKKKKKREKRKEYEEGELSDSDSEYIERVYDNIVSNFKTQGDESSKGKAIKTPNKVEVGGDAACRNIKINFKISSPSDSLLHTLVTPETKLKEINSDTTVNDINDAAILGRSDCKVQTDNVTSNMREDISKHTEPVCNQDLRYINKSENINATGSSITDNDNINFSNEAMSPNINASTGLDFEKKQNDTANSKLSQNENDVTKKSYNENNFDKVSNQNQANFYKPLADGTVDKLQSQIQHFLLDKEESNSDKNMLCNKEKSVIKDSGTTDWNPKKGIENSTEGDTNIPFLSEACKQKAKNATNEEIVSHIDILAALRKDILDKSIDVSGESSHTPALHEPKLTKVTGTKPALNIDTKRRISLEKYKEKTGCISKQSLFCNQLSKNNIKDEKTTKQSRGLTAKECERFNFRNEILKDDSSVGSDEDGQSVVSFDQEDALAPKSPEHNSCDTFVHSKPVIIPTESSINTLIKNSISDVDMRTTERGSVCNVKNDTKITDELLTSNIRPIKQTIDNMNEPIAMATSPRIDTVATSLAPTINLGDSNNLSISSKDTMLQSLNSSYLNLTQSPASYGVTPSYSPMESISSKEKLKHVYAPTCLQDSSHTSIWENPDLWDFGERQNTVNSSHVRENVPMRSLDDHDVRSTSVLRDDSRSSQDQFNQRSVRNDRDPRLNHERRSDCPPTPSHYFGRSDYAQTPTHPFGRADCPMTPIHPFGRSERPLTPMPSFGRSDCPAPTNPFPFTEVLQSPRPLMDIKTTQRPLLQTEIPYPSTPNIPGTPNHPFGHSDVGPVPFIPYGVEVTNTPSHAFGSSDIPRTPSHPFGSSKAPGTPRHPFGNAEYPSYRSDCPSTPSHPFGRSSASYSRQTDFTSISKENEQNRSDPRRYRNHSVNKTHSEHNDSEYNNYRTYREYREQNRRPNDFQRDYERERGRNPQRQFRESSMSRSDHNVGRDFSRDYSNDRSYSREPSMNRNFPSEFNRESNFTSRRTRESSVSRGRHREHSMGRTLPTDNNININEPRGRHDYQFPKTRNTLDVEPHSGPLFTIDTSVNRSFQAISNPIEDRRRRASSVGRSVVTNVKADLSQFEYPHNEEIIEKRNHFRRAQSVGRDVKLRRNDNKKFDFETYRKESKNKYPREKVAETLEIDSLSNTLCAKTTSSTPSKRDTRDINKGSYNKRDPRNKSILYNVEQNSKKQNTFEHGQSSTIAQSNNRDPRLRKKYAENDIKTKSKITNKTQNYGIVYTNDSIVKGTAISSGSGVKNYKIPKLKRMTTEAEKNDSDDSTTQKVEDPHNFKNITNQVKKSKEYIEKEDCDSKNLDKRSKSNVKNQTKKSYFSPERSVSETNLDSPKASPKSKSRKGRIKRLAYDSESDDSQKSVVKQTENKEIRSHGLVNTDPDSSKYEDMRNDTVRDVNEDALCEDATNMTNSTDQDEYDTESFTDFMASETIPTTKINQLIADLDKDLDSSNTIDIHKQPISELSLVSLLPKSDQIDIATLKKVENPSKTEVINRNAKYQDEVNIDNKETVLENKTLFLQKEISETDFTRDEKCDNFDKSFDSALPQSPVVSSPQKNDSSISLELYNTKNDAKSDNCWSSMMSDKNLINNVTNLVQKEKNTSCLSTDKNFEMSLPNYEPDIQKDNISTVSTTNVEKSDDLQSKLHDDSNFNSQNKKETLTPDSTVNTVESSKNFEEKNIDQIPDSTNDANFESITLGNHEPQKDFAINNKEPSDSQSASKIASVGNLLTILQGKSKIKELLRMLTDDDSPETEKIRRKLEKLSEIVSDEEDSVETNINLIRKNSTEIDTLDKGNSNVSLGETSEENISESIEQVHAQETVEDILEVPKKKIFRKPLRRKTAKQKRNSKFLPHKLSQNTKRITRSKAATKEQVKPKKPMSRELMMLQEDVKEMFISDDVLNATGIRMCRLAKLVNDNVTTKKFESHDMLTNKPQTRKLSDGDPGEKSLTSSPLVVLEKVIDNVNEKNLNQNSLKPPRKKPGPKPKLKVSTNNIVKTDACQILAPQVKSVRHKPGPFSKTKHFKQNHNSDLKQKNIDRPSVNMCASDSNSSDSDNESISSLKNLQNIVNLNDGKSKIKRKRNSWKLGIIKSKKKKMGIPLDHNAPGIDVDTEPTIINESDLFCFTDPDYCFQKNVTNYECRFCTFVGNDIVNHFKTKHPHFEVPLSRFNPKMAAEAIKQSLVTNFQTLIKIPNKRHVCRFCSEVFLKGSSLENFFWHVVSKHTGEYKKPCTECANDASCSMSMDMPSLPKSEAGILLGYICGKCNYTQVSLENLKNHVSRRHHNLKTEVYTICLDDMTQKAVSAFVKSKQCVSDSSPSKNRSLRSNKKSVDIVDENSDVSEFNDQNSESETVSYRDTVTQRFIKDKPGPASKKIQLQTRFEYEDTASEASDVKSSEELNSRIEIKSENEQEDFEGHNLSLEDIPSSPMDVDPEKSSNLSPDTSANNVIAEQKHENLFYGAHFKVNITETGTKEYICSVKGDHNHYRTALIISLKKHVQMRHSELWDGYCCVCKVIVTPFGVHKFQDCLAHFLINHMDDFPVLENSSFNKTDEFEPTETSAMVVTDRASPLSAEVSKKYINVRPLSDLKIRPDYELDAPTDAEPTLLMPRINSVVSLNPSERRSSSTIQITDQSSLSTAPLVTETGKPIKKIESITSQNVKNEWPLTSIVSEKHRVVLEAMLLPAKLVQIFKCAGKFCSFTSDSVDLSLLHATTHQREGGAGALRCAYCTFDARDNGIDLVSHVFREHGHCRYACQNCFYRAGAALLVETHAQRSHPDEPIATVLRAPNATAMPSMLAGTSVLSREQAVPEYICVYGKGLKDVEQCKFRTYTGGKFTEHYKLRHPEAVTYQCSVCGESFGQSMLLLRHQKMHGLRQYHCTYCMHAADTDIEMIAHATETHPARRPQAYLRHIIETKEANGDVKFKVLPLVHFNKGTTAVPVDVEPAELVDDPVKEANRALELEKLIGQTAQMIKQAMARVSSPLVEAAVPAASVVTISDTTNCTSDLSPDFCTQDQNMIDKDRVQITLMDSETRPKTPSLVSSPALTVVIKKEPESDAPAVISLAPITQTSNAAQIQQNADLVDDVICLNSDEDNDDDVGDVIDISDNDDTAPALPVATSSPAATKEDRVPMNRLFTCAACKVTIKNVSGFKRHLSMCYSSPPLHCGHCPILCDDKNTLVDHYKMVHAPVVRYVCEYCQHVAPSSIAINRHMKQTHDIRRPSYRSVAAIETHMEYIVGTAKKLISKPTKAIAEAPSGGESSSSATRLRRYGPADIHRLPIAPILDEPIKCTECGFGTKVRVNMVRHLQLHASQQPAPNIAPINPVPHLETNEKHFDKMTNLAASSNATRAIDRAAPPAPPALKPHPVTPRLLPEAAARYPQFVPERSRHACGAPGCSYISSDEGMLRRHWETLHSTCTVFRCAHCPPDQQLDPSLPLTSARIVSHLRMHDARLFACSACSVYYHYQHQAVEKHFAEKHPGAGDAQVVVVRQPTPAAPPPEPSGQLALAPTMDLKPWQCGLCDFKSMMRPDVVEHCGRLHNTKMQYKCRACPLRGTGYDSVLKHQTSAHPGRIVDVVHLYYREGSLPAGPDGAPRWQVQQRWQRVEDGPDTRPVDATDVKLAPIMSPLDLNIIKSEILEEPHDEPIEPAQSLMDQFDKFCDPQGKKFACPLCKVTEETKEAMTSHLYEELNYRKWSCNFCTYKAFHKIRLMEHTFHEHRQTQEPTALPADTRIEAWVEACLAHQERLMGDRPVSQTVTQNDSIRPTPKDSTPDEFILSNDVPSLPIRVTPDLPSVGGNMKELEDAFGAFGAPKDMSFCCPKCTSEFKEQDEFKDHLEMELAKVRWCCSRCPQKFHQYHEAQLHCKSAHLGPPARTIEASRDPELRSTWIATVVQVQRLTMNYTPVAEVTLSDKAPLQLFEEPESTDNSLLVVRYKERITSPRERPVRRRRPTCLAEPDSDDERLIIDETLEPATTTTPATTSVQTVPPPELGRGLKKCPHCDYVTKVNMTQHIVRHYNLKPYNCVYCDFNGYLQTVYKHQDSVHPGLVHKARITVVPNGPPPKLDLKTFKRRSTLTCLLCNTTMPAARAALHARDAHPGEEPQLAERGTFVLKCSYCPCLRQDVLALTRHHEAVHSQFGYQLKCVTTRVPSIKHEVIKCGRCPTTFTHRRAMYAHHEAVHPGTMLDFTSRRPGDDSSVNDDEDSDMSTPDVSKVTATPTKKTSPIYPTMDAVVSFDVTGVKRKLPDDFARPDSTPIRRVAKKSTTQLPTRARAVAKKSTTQLPMYYLESYSDSDVETLEEYSFYGTKPKPLKDYANVTALMPVPMLNTVMSFTLDKLNELTNINPTVIVQDIKKK